MKAFIRRRDLLNIWTPRHASLCFVAGNQELEEIVSLPGRERQKRQWRPGWNCRCFNSYSPAGLSIIVWNEWRPDNRFARKGSQVQAALTIHKCTRPVFKTREHTRDWGASHVALGKGRRSKPAAEDTWSELTGTYVNGNLLADAVPLTATRAGATERTPEQQIKGWLSWSAKQSLKQPVCRLCSLCKAFCPCIYTYTLCSNGQLSNKRLSALLYSSKTEVLFILKKKASEPYIVKWIERPQKANFKAQSHLPHVSVQEELNKHLTNLGSDRRELWKSVIGFLFWKYFETLRGSWNTLRSGFTSDAPEMWVIFMKDLRLVFSQPRLLIGWRLDLFFTFFFWYCVV